MAEARQERLDAPPLVKALAALGCFYLSFTHERWDRDGNPIWLNRGMTMLMELAEHPQKGVKAAAVKAAHDYWKD